jgi:sugar lactone lactonase YvrE
MTVRTPLLAALSVLSLSPAAPAWDRGEATTFARLPAGERNPEGIALDKKTGDVYVADFDFRGTDTGMGHVIVFNKEGKLRRVVNVKNSSPALLGLDFHPKTHALLVIDFGAKQVLTVNPVTGDSTVFTKLDPAAGPNALTFDADGNVYISDSFQGVIWKTPPTGTGAAPPASWASSPLLTTTGKPPFGANGMAFNRDFSTMFVANTGNDTILQIPASGTPVTEFTHSINGADGLAIDEHDNIWVCANQSDEIVVLDKTGKAIAKLGDFDGIGERREPRGFLFPASLVFSGEFVLVTNLALDTRLFGFDSVDAQWAAQVKTYTVAKIKRRIPNLPDRHDD